MTDPYEMILQNAAKQSQFPASSRYYQIETTTLTRKDGTVITYILRRAISPPEKFALLTEHTVRDGDRLDNISATYLGDPEQFWRICDANAAMRPDDLTETAGGKIRITLPEGIPGAADA